MTDKQKYAIKLAINTMNKHFGRHYNTVYGNRETGISVGYGEAINILSDMISNADNHDCNCKHNSNSRVKVNSLEIIVRMIGNKPYYELKYRQVGKKDYSIGYSSYDLKIVLGYIDTYFEIVESDNHTNADRIRNMSDEELAEFIEQISTDSMETISFGTKEYEEIWEHKETALQWLQSEVEE